MQNDAQKHITVDAIWNIISLFVLSIGVLAFNSIIAMCYSDISMVGYFNQYYAYYIAFSQIAVCGIHNAILYFGSVEECEERQHDILRSSLIVVMATSILSYVVISSCCLLLSKWISERVVLEGISIAAIGLIPFSLNKVLLNYYNAKKKMRVYAVFQALRSVLIASCLLVLCYNHVEAKWLALSFFAGESILLVIQIPFCGKAIFKGRFNRNDARMIAVFGTKIIPSNLVLELNTRIDVISLGVLGVSDRLIGIYSFAIVFSDGFYQLILIIKKILNPEIARRFANGDELSYIKESIFSRTRRIFPAAGILTVGLFVCYCYIVNAEYVIGWVYLAIIIFSQVLTHREIILGSVFSLRGAPAKESLINTLSVTVNFVCNLILIRLMGVAGAAIATSISYCAFAIFLRSLYFKTYERILL